MGERQLRKILEVGIYEDTRTVNLMDRFEGFGHDVAYQQLVLLSMRMENL